MRLRGRTITKLGRWLWFIIWIKELARECRTMEEALEEGELEFELIPAVQVKSHRYAEAYPPRGRVWTITIRRKAPRVPARRRGDFS